MTSTKASKFKVNDRVRVIKNKNIFSKGYTGNWSGEIFIINSVLKINSWTYKINDLNAENDRKFLWKTAVVEYIINDLLSRTRQSN